MEHILNDLKETAESNGTISLSINYEDAGQLLKYINTLNEQLGKEKTINEIRKNDINYMSKRIEILEKELEKLDVKKLNAVVREKQEKIDEKISYLSKCNRYIQGIERELRLIFENLGLDFYEYD